MLIKTGARDPKAGEIYHAELPKNFMTDPRKLENFVQDEVYLQFSHHFNKL